MLLTDLIYYDLKVAALIAVFYLFYMLLLARETTHTLNRMVLLSAIALSSVLPLCVITLHRTEVVESKPYPIMEPAAVDDVTSVSITEALEQSFDWTIPVAMVLLAGTIIRLLYLSQSYRKLKRLIRSGEKHILPSGTNVSVVNAPLAPFSWMQTMVLPRADRCAKAVAGPMPTHTIKLVNNCTRGDSGGRSDAPSRILPVSIFNWRTEKRPPWSEAICIKEQYSLFSDVCP